MILSKIQPLDIRQRMNHLRKYVLFIWQDILFSNFLANFGDKRKHCKFGERCRDIHPQSKEMQQTHPRAENRGEYREERDHKSKSSSSSATKRVDSAHKTETQRGKISSMNSKGFGFIQPNNGDKRIFYRISISSALRYYSDVSDVEGNRTLQERDEVEFIIVPDKVRKGEIKAAEIRLIGKVNITGNTG